MTFFCINPKNPKVSMFDPAFWVSTFFGSGLVKPASGTWGTAAGLLILGPLSLYVNAYILGFLVIVLTLIGTYYIATYQRLTGAHDASEIVIDEVCGLGVALTGIACVTPLTLPLLLLAFFFFRLFDVLKPWPASWADQKLPGAYGVMLDDLVAGFMAGGFSLWALEGLHAFGFTNL